MAETGFESRYFSSVRVNASRLLAISVMVLMSCSKPERRASSRDAATAALAPSDPVALAATKFSADEIWKTRCKTCHGDEGRGDGIIAPMLTPLPRDFTNAAWQRTTSDERIRKVIVEGSAALGLADHMKPIPELAKLPDEVEGLVRKVRSYGPK